MIKYYLLAISEVIIMTFILFIFLFVFDEKALNDPYFLYIATLFALVILISVRTKIQRDLMKTQRDFIMTISSILTKIIIRNLDEGNKEQNRSK